MHSAAEKSDSICHSPSPPEAVSQSFMGWLCETVEMQSQARTRAADSIKSQLLLIGAIDEAGTELFAEQTRDCYDLRYFATQNLGLSSSTNTTLEMLCTTR